jgi:hypothetical protein
VVTTTQDAGKARWKHVSAKDRKELMRSASRAFWDALSPEQRSALMKRRAKKRKRKGGV